MKLLSLSFNDVKVCDRCGKMGHEAKDYWAKLSKEELAGGRSNGRKRNNGKSNGGKGNGCRAEATAEEKVLKESAINAGK